MQKWINMHTHTPLCGHAVGEPEEYAREVIRAGVAWYGVSDHFPLPCNYREDYSMRLHQLPDYRWNWMKRVRSVLEPAGVQVLYGTEVDYLTDETMPVVRRLVNAEPFDYRIYSIHFIGTEPFDFAPDVGAWPHYGIDGTWSRYFETLEQMVRNEDFEIAGHLDLAKRFAFYPSNRKSITEAAHDILKILAKRDICMEINTSGLRKTPREMYPSAEIVRMAYDAGVRLTLGTDAHDPKDVATNLTDAVELARSVGYRSVFVFRQKQPIELPLD